MISRPKMSAPTKWLVDMGLLTGKVLDFGCGYGEDADVLGWDKYDPETFPQNYGKYERILCQYVLNTLPISEENAVLDDLRTHLKSGGIAYIVVRRDVKQDGVTSKGTYQRTVMLDLPSVHRTKWYEIYQISK